jgi:hypothetical protein
MKQKLKKSFSIIKEIIKLPKVIIYFKDYDKISKENYLNTYKYFNKLHRLKLFRNKTIGIALIDLNSYNNFDEYYKSINGKNSAAYYTRKAIRKGYKFIKIDRNDYIDDIYEINTSTEYRQGRKMSASYIKKVEKYKNEKNYRYFGVVNNENKLVSYCNIGFYGEFALVSTLLGHKKYLNDGIMYLMMVEFNRIMFDEYKNKGYKYIMYDTFFGSSEGLKQFKRKLGYKPYKVSWKWEN